MVWWKCEVCGYTFQADTVPDDSKCPDCLESCTFKNVTCYLPECGFDDGKEHIDHRL